MKTVLLVEDDENDIVFFQRVSQMAGFNHPLVVKRNPTEAIEYLESHVQRENNSDEIPGLVFLDLKLAQKSGLEVLKWLRTQPLYQSLVVIVYTSSPATSDITAAYEIGASSYVLKEGDPQRLIDLLKLVEEFWFRLNVRPASGPDFSSN